MFCPCKQRKCGLYGLLKQLPLPIVMYHCLQNEKFPAIQFMMNRCAKFHVDTQSGYRLKFNLASAIEHSETANFVYTLYRKPIQASNFGGTFHQLFLWIFLWGFHTRCPFTFSTRWCKKSKMTKSSNQGALPWYHYYYAYIVHFRQSRHILVKVGGGGGHWETRQARQTSLKSVKFLARHTRRVESVTQGVVDVHR